VNHTGHGLAPSLHTRSSGSVVGLTPLVQECHDIPVERDGPGGPAVQPFHEPVIYGLLDRVAGSGPGAEVVLGLELS
jgi:hypothetical protein